MKQPEILSTADVAQRLGVSERRVRALAQERQIGFMLNSRQRVFTLPDLQKLRPKKRGRPRDPNASPAAIKRRAWMEARRNSKNAE